MEAARCNRAGSGRRQGEGRPGPCGPLRGSTGRVADGGCAAGGQWKGGSAVPCGSASIHSSEHHRAHRQTNFHACRAVLTHFLKIRRLHVLAECPYHACTCLQFSVTFLSPSHLRFMSTLSHPTLLLSASLSLFLPPFLSFSPSLPPSHLAFMSMAVTSRAPAPLLSTLPAHRWTRGGMVGERVDSWQPP